mgnify:CR=1 FL=1
MNLPRYSRMLDIDMVVDFAYIFWLRWGLIDDTKVILSCNDDVTEVMEVIRMYNEVDSEGTEVILRWMSLPLRVVRW